MRRASILLVAVLALTSCTKVAADLLTHNLPTGTGSTTTTDYGMSATINGSSWAAGATPSVVHSNNIFSMAGLNLSSYGVGIAISGITAPGTYSLVYPTAIGSSATVSNTGGGWSTYLQGGTGSVTFTTFTSNHVAGTFAFDAVAASGSATGTIHITNGKFDFTY